MKTYIREHRQTGIPGQSQPQTAGLRAEPVAPALRRIPPRADGDQAGRQWLSLRFAGGDHRHEPAVPEQTKSGCAEPAATIERGDEDAPTNPPAAFPAAPCFAAPDAPWRCRGSNRFPPSPIRHRAAAFPKRFGVVFMGNGINEDHWSAEGSGAEMKLSKTLSAAGAVEAEDQRDRRSLRQGAHRPGHSPRRRPAACSPARTFRRAPSSTPASAWTR